MAKQRSPKKVKLVVGLLFTLFLVINAIFHTVAVHAWMNDKNPVFPPLEDISPAVRILLFLVGIGVSWLLARMLYRFLIKGEVTVGDSVNTSYILLFYLGLTFATFSFLGVMAWFWLPLLFLVLLIYSIFTLWSLIGGLFTIGAVVLTFFAIIGTWFFVTT
jgi:hypothetical protein